jgi:hypothetical protein
MGYKVTYTDKSGNKQQITFGSETLANNYSRTVKNATVETTATEAPIVAVSRVSEGSLEAQKAATKRYYLGDRASLPGASSGEYEASEQDAEAMAEHFADARASGQCMEDAHTDWDFIQNGKV